MSMFPSQLFNGYKAVWPKLNSNKTAMFPISYTLQYTDSNTLKQQNLENVKSAARF